MVEPSRIELQQATIRTTEDISFAAHLGVIAVARTTTVNGSTDGSTIADTYSGIQLFGGTLAGRDVFTAWNAGNIRYVQLSHYDLVYEPVRRYYYAGLRMSHAAAPGAVARIHPDSGEVTYSEGLGADVRSIAVSADGSTLYAGLQSRSEVVQLSLSDLRIVQRIALEPLSWAYGLTVSPSNSNEAAAYLDSSQRGPVVIRNGLLLPDGPGRDRARSGATDEPLLYTADGAHVLMFAEGGALLRLTLGGNGFTSQVDAAPGSYFGRSLSLEVANVVAGTVRLQTADLASLGSVADPDLSDCRPLNEVAKWVCKRGFTLNVAVLDSSSLTLIPDGLIPFALPVANAGGSLYRVVPGPRGQVAVMVTTGVSFGGDWVGLFDNPDFR